MLKPVSAVRNERATSRTRSPACSWARLAWPALLGALLLIGAGSAAHGTPPQAQEAQALRGCCLCRGPAAGQPHASLSCTDNLGVTACELKCKGEGATSFVYGNAQSCAGGCAGLATQSLQ